MLDPKRLRTDLEAVKAGLARRGLDLSEIERAAALEVEERTLKGKVEGMRAQIRSLSKEVGQARKAGDIATADAKADQSRALGEEERKIEAEATSAGAVGAVVGRQVGSAQEDLPQVGAGLGILDLERGAKLSGSMFPVFR
ncbi:MAG TPA: hypothetical protein VNT52_03755, partial [Acidimicrobiales bacterium]|nr:hypothetical protein [Acidimicrobiales bacterium]